MVRQSRRLVKLFSCLVTLAIVGVIFFIPIRQTQNVTAEPSDSQTGQTFFTLERYNIIREPVSRSPRTQNRMSKPAEKSPSSENVTHKSEQTETAEQNLSEPEHSQNETRQAEFSQNVAAETEIKQSSGETAAKPSGKKSNKKVIEYKPDWTIDKMPVYPMSARRLGQQGTVGVTAYIDGSGNVINVLATKPSGVKSLDDAAVAAVRCWSFDRLHLTDKMNIVKTEIIFRLE